jgi:bifunctional UDP-N-acetylglucosamine pyrophosphorylase / glucosamine-1-phosphate N-acetyltransferase
MGLQVIILAAGNGSRMNSHKSKVLHQIGGLSMLRRVVNTAFNLAPERVHIVHGAASELLQQELQHLDINWVYQQQQLGTAHAVLQALPHCKPTDKVLVLYADVPLISMTTLESLLKQTDKGLSLVVTKLDNPSGFGRILRNDMGHIVAIVEQRDADSHTLKIKEVNTGILCGRVDLMRRLIAKVDNSNAQQEYYLPDIIAYAVTDGVHVGGVWADSTQEAIGVNTRWQLAQLERFYQESVARKLCDQGVTVIDPARLDVRGDAVIIARDVILEPNIILSGKVEIASGCYIGANVVLHDVTIGPNTKILSHSVVEGADIGADACIGPFARIRPQTTIATGVKVGNFVEVKNSNLAAQVKAGHLSYLGDAILGAGVNVGAGTITCNYDGKSKHQTNIGAGAFIGSNTALVAPLNIGERATIGAGSVITKDAPAQQLSLSRSQQKSIVDWQSPSLSADDASEAVV